MGIRAKYTQIFNPIVIVLIIDMIELERDASV
jgi:hypothetical protein